jgi:hypothetical protein
LSYCHCSSANLEYATKRARETEAELATLRQQMETLQHKDVNLRLVAQALSGLLKVYTHNASMVVPFFELERLPSDWKKWTTEQYCNWIQSQPHEVRRAFETVDMLERRGFAF